MSDNTSSQNSTESTSEIVPASAVIAINGKPCTTSLDVAKYFDKLHKNVIRDIHQISLDYSENFTGLNFEPSEYTDSTGRKLPMYQISFDGFMVLAMSYTGKKAAQIKEAYIAAFNQMRALLEQELCARAAQVPSDAAMQAKLDQILKNQQDILAGQQQLLATRRKKQIAKLESSDKPLMPATNPVAQFLQECCEVESVQGKRNRNDFTFSESSSTLYAAFCIWFKKNWDQNANYTPSHKSFSVLLACMGFPAAKRGHANIKFRFGIRLYKNIFHK